METNFKNILARLFFIQDRTIEWVVHHLYIYKLVSVVKTYMYELQQVAIR